MDGCAGKRQKMATCHFQTNNGLQRHNRVKKRRFAMLFHAVMANVGRHAMYELTNTDKIWNHACQGGGESPLPGDTALAGLLLFHGPAMNGGVLHAIECLSPEQLVSAQEGYKYFGYGGVADLIGAGEEATRQGNAVEPLQAAFDRRYSALVPNDEVLVKSFEQHYKQYPLEYSPLIE